MADILLNVDGAQKVFKNTVHLAANTETGGKAVYTEDSETTTAYLLTDPTGVMPTFEGGAVQFTGTDGAMFAAMNGKDATADGIVAYMVSEEFGPYYFYAVKPVIITNEMLNTLTGKSNTGKYKQTKVFATLPAGWTKISQSIVAMMNTHMTTNEMQADLRKRGGIGLDTFSLSSMDAYLSAMFVKSEIAIAKYARANYMQDDPSKPDFVQNKIGGCIAPKLSVQTIEWDGEVGNRPYLCGKNGDPVAVQVYKGAFYKENLLDAKITVTTKKSDAADPITNTITVDSASLEALLMFDNGIMQIAELAIIYTMDINTYSGSTESGLYLVKDVRVVSGVTTSTYISKIEFPNSIDPNFIPINAAFLPEYTVIGKPTVDKLGGVKNPSSSIAANSDDSNAYVNDDGLIVIPHGNKIAKAVLYTVQTLTSSEQAQARANLGITYPTDIVKYTEQSLTADQKKQARANIDVEPLIVPFTIDFSKKLTGYHQYPNAYSATTTVLYGSILDAVNAGRVVLAIVPAKDENYTEEVLYLSGREKLGGSVDDNITFVRDRSITYVGTINGVKGDYTGFYHYEITTLDGGKTWQYRRAIISGDDYSNALVKSGLKNPTSLTITTDDGEIVYDGSEAKKVTIPSAITKTSQLTNNSGFLTEHQSLIDYVKKTEVDNIVRKAIVLESTTANSTKKFKITVDDSGTLKATEVTS